MTVRRTDSVNLNVALGDEDDVMGWLVTYVENVSGDDLELNLCFGSDDNGQIWIDNENVHNMPVCRGSSGCQDNVFAVLTPGFHAIKMAAWDRGGGWNCNLTLQRADFTPILNGDPDLRFLGPNRPDEFEAPEDCLNPPCAASRSFSSSRYAPGDSVTVTVSARNIGGATTVEETLPPGWTAANVSDDGTVDGETITWQIDSDGDVSYELVSPDEFCDSVELTGTLSGDCEVDVAGDAQLRCSDPELFGYWRFEETDAGDFARDESDNEMDGTYGIGIEPDVEGAPGFGSGASFDGTIDGVVDLGAESPLGTLLSDFTITAWIFPTDPTGKNRIIGSLQPNGWGFGPVDGTTLQITTFGVKDYDAAVELPLDTWSHVAVVLDVDANASFYVDGALVGESPAGGPARESADNFYIGRASNAEEYFTGRIDEVAVFTGSLTEEGIADVMENGALGGSPGGSEFVRGDADASGAINITDGIFVLNFLFLGGPTPSCSDAADADDSGAINITDGIYILNFLFLGGDDPPAPHPACGEDPDRDADGVDCATGHDCA